MPITNTEFQQIRLKLEDIAVERMVDLGGPGGGSVPATKFLAAPINSFKAGKHITTYRDFDRDSCFDVQFDKVLNILSEYVKK